MAIGVAEGDSIGDATGLDKVEGTETVPTLLGVGDGDGVGVAVETSIGAGDGVSVGTGVCPKATSAISDAVRANPRRLFRMRG
jgi:hypothetical protein